MTENPPAARPPLRDGAALALGAFVVYALVGQSRFYLFDAETFYMLVARGQLEHPNHPLYLPINWAVAGMLEPLGVSLFRAMTIASALGTAVWVLLAHHAAATMGLDRGRAGGVALLCATAPSIVFFATVIEVHGVFLAFAGLAWWLLARAARKPSAVRVFALGLGTGLAATAHATGHLLTLATGLVLLAEVPALRAPKALVRAALAGALGHVLARVAAGALAGAGDLQHTLDYVATSADRFALSKAKWTVWNEWLWPFAPLSVVALSGLAARRTRPLALAVCAALVPYLLVAALMLGDAIVEHGAYLQPLAFPAAVVAARLLSGRAVLACAALGLALGVVSVKGHDHAAPDAVRPGDVIALRGDGEAVFVMADEAEARPVMLAAPDLAVVRVETLTQGLLADDDATAFARFDAAFDAITAGGKGVVFLSQAAARELVLRGDRLAGHLERAYELVPRRSGTFRCYELRRK